MHYGFIEKFIEELGTRFNIREIAFDRWGAVQMTQNLETLGFTVVQFGQGFRDMSPPTKELMAIACEEYGAKFFANGANPGGVLEHPGTIKDPAKVRESWNSVYQGSGNSHRIAVLEEGMHFNPISITNEQAQFLETRKFQINEIARIFRVPPHMVGDLEKSSFSNIEQQSLEFVKYTLDPWVIRWEQSLARALFSETEKTKLFFKFNVDGLLRGDYVSRMREAVKLLKQKASA